MLPAKRTPLSPRMTSCSIGDHILALFYGEWHPGIAYDVSAEQVTVWWTAEETETIVPIWAVIPLNSPHSCGPCAVHDRVLALFNGKWHHGMVTAMFLVHMEVCWDNANSTSLVPTVNVRPCE